MDRKPGHLTKNVQDAVNALVWIKLVGVGNACVGKTCIIKHFCESKDIDCPHANSEFSSGYQPTVGVDYGFKIQNVQGLDLRVHLWDLSGSPEYIDVRNELYSQTDTIFLVFDVTNQASYDSLETWLKEINKYSTGSPDIVLVANKTDMKGKRIISSADTKKFAQSHKIQLYETSASTGDGIDKLFTDILCGIIERKKLHLRSQQLAS